MTEENKPAAYLYTLEYGTVVVNTEVSLHQLNYPFGVCGADYLRESKDGISYVRQTPLYTHPAPVNTALLDKAAELACDAVAFNGGSVQMEAHVRAAIAAAEGKV